MLGTFRLDAIEIEGLQPHDQAGAQFFRSCDGATAIEYAIIASSVALVIVLAVGGLGTNLSASYGDIAHAFP